MKKNVASQVVGAQMVTAADGTAFTGSVTCYVTGDGGAQAIGSVGSGACTHEGNGFHTYAPAQAETNYNHVAFTFIGTGAIPATVQIYTTFPQTGDSFARLGAPAGASVSADVAAVKAETASIQSDTNDIQTRLPAALVGGRIDASVGAMAADTLTASALATTAVDEIVDAVWDEVLTGATHNVPSSAGRRLRQLSNVVIWDGTAQGGTINTIQLDTGASATDGAYDPATVVIVSGTGAGQTRLILQYIGATRVAVVDRDWKITPDNTSVFQIQASSGREHVNEGLAQAGTPNTITLNALASSSDDDYNGQIVFIRSGTGADQTGVVVDYDGATKIATISTAMANGEWSVIPDATSAYVMLPSSPVVLAAIEHAGAIVAGLTATGRNEVADSMLARNVNGGSSAGRTVKQALKALRNKVDISGGTLTVYDEDDVTPSWTAAVGTSPGDPISSVDPA